MRRKAVLCGINLYSNAPQLKGCINDIENLRLVLIKKFGFASQDIHLLKDQQCVKRNVLEEWRWLTEGANAGDTLVFHHSSHGSSMPDPHHDEADGRDEITCLYDMDFNNPGSYISDDEWYAWVQQVNPDANLIIIKDTCHSGGSTRLLSVQDSAGYHRDILVEAGQLTDDSPDQAISEHRVTNARYLIPPDHQDQDWRSGATPKQTSKPSRLREVEQVNLMACKETQTAADAYIGGRYNGAFTYYLCQALRNNPQLGSLSLIDTVAQLLQGNYEQVPQHEGRAVPAPIFGSQSSRVENGDSMTIPTLPIVTVETGDRQTTQQMLIQAYIKLVDAVTALESDTSKAMVARDSRRVLVTVHGIGSHSKGYSNQWWESLQPHVGTTYGSGTLAQGRQEVIWSDLVNPGRNLTRNLEQSEVNQLRQSILDVIDDRRDLIAAQSRSFDPSPQTRGSDFAIDDFLIYMLDDGMRQRIIDRFTRVVGPLLVAGATVDIISHSWGTVIAYEGLRELEQKSELSGRVGTWFTVGSALSIPPVQGRLRPANRPTDTGLAPYPKGVGEWVNLDAQGDLVGGRLRRKFPVNREYLELPPSTCPRRLWGFDLGCAHGSYFQRENLKVNRDIFAQHILGLARGIEEESDLGIGESPNGAIESYASAGV